MSSMNCSSCNSECAWPVTSRVCSVSIRLFSSTGSFTDSCLMPDRIFKHVSLPSLVTTPYLFTIFGEFFKVLRYTCERSLFMNSTVWQAFCTEEANPLITLCICTELPIAQAALIPVKYTP